MVPAGLGRSKRIAKRVRMRGEARSEATSGRLLAIVVDSMLLSLCSSRPSLLAPPHLLPVVAHLEHQDHAAPVHLILGHYVEGGVERVEPPEEAVIADSIEVRELKAINQAHGGEELWTRNELAGFHLEH